jgi:hypothetical protein
MPSVARVTAAAEALEAGDVELAREILADLLGEVAPISHRFRCLDCGTTFEWPGLHERHCAVSGHRLRKAA